MIVIKGTVSKSLISYIVRIEKYLGIYDHYNTEMYIQPTCDGDAGGLCYGTADDVLILIARKDSQGKFTREQLMTHIAHEMIHAQQLHTKRMINAGFTQTSDGEILYQAEVSWEGEEYGFDVAYNDQPWEIDAHGRQAEVHEACR